MRGVGKGWRGCGEEMLQAGGRRKRSERREKMKKTWGGGRGGVLKDK